MRTTRLAAVTALLLSVFSGAAIAQGNLQLDYSTYLGGGSTDDAYGLAVDGAGNAYLVGNSMSADFPTANPYQAGLRGSNYDAFVSKFSSSGSALVYSTFLGGSGYETGYAISLDTAGCAYVAGETRSLDFPTVNPYQANIGGQTDTAYDAFVVKIGSSGSQLIFSTYFGGSLTDKAYGIAVSDAERVHLTGVTYSLDFPTKLAYQATLGYVDAGDADAFVSKFFSDGSQLVFSTYLGGDYDDRGFGIAVDTQYFACVVGYSDSINFPTLNPYQPSQNGARDVFVTKFGLLGGLQFSTYLGGAGNDSGSAIALGSDNSPCLTGNTLSSDFPTVSPYQASIASPGFIQDAFLSRLSSSGSALLYSTYLGGANSDVAQALAIDGTGALYLAGYTMSVDFPTVRPYQAGLRGSNYDAFAASFDSSGTSLLWSTYLGGTQEDQAKGAGLDPSGRMLITGTTLSNDFPTVNPYQANYGGGITDAFLSILRLVEITPTPLPSPTPVRTPTRSPTPIGFHTPAPTLTPSPVPTPSISCDFNVSGHVVNSVLYENIPGAEVRLLFGDGESNLTTADGNGAYAFAIYDTHPPGTVVVEARRRGYLPGSRTTLWSCETTIADFNLELPPADETAGVGEGDYNGDGTSDIAVFRPSAGFWAIRDLTRIYFGGEGDELVPGDYDGDGTTEAGVYRPASALWAIHGLTRVYFGEFGDLAVPGDYDGNGTCESGIFRPPSGLWSIRGLTRVYFGGSEDRPVPGDYNGEGRKDIAVFKADVGQWAILLISRVYFGAAGDDLVPGDYDGNGTWKAAIFRPAEGLWSIRGVSRIYLGSMDDQPVPADFNGNGSDDIAIFRGPTGLWSARNLTRVYFGSTGDVPATR